MRKHPDGGKMPAALLDAAKAAPTKEKKRRQRRTRKPTPDAMALWEKGEQLKEGARRVIGIGQNVVQQVLKTGLVLSGITPAKALDHALGPAMLRVAGYDDKTQQSGPVVQLINLIAPAPGAAQLKGGPDLNMMLLDSVRDLDAQAIALPAPSCAPISDESDAGASSLIEAAEHEPTQ